MAKIKFEYIVTMILFGSIGLFVKGINLPSAYIVQYRSIIGVLFLGSIYFFRKSRIQFSSILQNKVPITLSGVMLGLNWAFLFEAYQHIPVNLATMIYYFAPVFVFIVSPWVFKEKISHQQFFGIVMAVFGMLCIYMNSVSNLSISGGVISALISAILYACIMMVNRKIENVSGMDSTFVQLCIASLVMSVYCFITQGEWLMIPSNKDLIFICILGIIHTGVAYSLYFYSLQHLPSVDSALLSYLDPAFALLFSYLWLNESLSIIQMIGVLMMLGGCVYAQLFKDKK